MTIPPFLAQGILPLTTNVPSDPQLFDQYFIRLYEQISLAVNAKDFSFFTIPITTTPVNITNVANFGAFTICVSGEKVYTDGGYLPTLVVALAKSSIAVAGTIAVLTSQVGTGTAWAGSALTITSTGTNYQIAHNAAGLTGNFNIRIIGTQP